MVQYLLGEQALKQLADTVKRVAKLERVVLGTGWNRDVAMEQVVVGKLDEELERNLNATMSVWKPDLMGGLDSDTGQNIEVIDVGMIPAGASPIPENTVCAAAYSRGAWVLIAYDCDGV